MWSKEYAKALNFLPRLVELKVLFGHGAIEKLMIAEESVTMEEFSLSLIRRRGFGRHVFA